MDTKQLQTWLKRNGFHQGEIDGIAGKQTKEALRKAQQYLADKGLYKDAVDSLYGKHTQEAITKYNTGKRYFNKYNVSFNIYDKNSIDTAVRALRAKGIGRVKVNGRVINLGSNSAFQDFYNAAGDMIRGVRSVSLTDDRDVISRKAKGYIGDVNALGSTAAATDGGGSSLSRGTLDDLVMRYAYDKYHGTPINDDEWGISYNYTPHTKPTLATGITLRISDKYTPEQASQIARGAGMESYLYNGKKYDVNLFTGQRGFSDRKTFDDYIENIRRTRGVQAAQQAYNAELARQYNTYGIDFNQLKNKTGVQWNTLFGVVPYGYNPESVGAILSGEQAVHDPNTSRPLSGLTTSKAGYRYTGKDSDGRFEYNNYDEWRNARILAQSGLHNGGLSGIRAVSSTYYMGFPVAPEMRGELAFVGARPNGDQIDRMNYYALTDEDRGSGKMQPWVYNEAKRNPAGTFKYLNYIYGNRRRSGDKLVAPHDRNYKFDEAEATRLAKAAGITSYHTNDKGGSFINQTPLPIVGAHDL